MRRSLLVLILFASLLLAYPNLPHPPVAISTDGWVTLDSELEEDGVLRIEVRFDSDSFKIYSPTATHHRVSIPLSEEFEYEVWSGSKLLGRGRVIPPRAIENDFSFAVYGDSRWGKRVHERIVEMVKGIPFLFNLGDIVNSDVNDSDWEDFFDVIGRYDGILFTARGNHDAGLRYNRFLYPNVYSVRIGRIRFLVLDSNSILFKSDLESLLRSHLEEDTFKIVMFHHVVFSCGPHGGDLDTLLRRGVHDIIKGMGVRLVFTSHDHNYQRLERDGVTYIVTGGGGAALYGLKYEDCGAKLISYCRCHNFVVGRVEGNVLSFSVYNLKGEKIDGFSFEIGR